jgi:hypothetical protein
VEVLILELLDDGKSTLRPVPFIQLVKVAP